MDRPPRLALLAALACIALALAAACDDGGYSDNGATATQPFARNAPTSASTTAAPNEAGEAPIFYRTADDFATLRAGEAYKVLFRVTGGYAGDTITVTSRCLTCPNSADRQPIASEANRAEPGEGEAEGSYYPYNLDLPFEGTWEVVVTAGDDTATLEVEAQPAGGATG
jgi:hypothetical protein